METPTVPDVNPYSEIWPLEHNAEIWGHRSGGGCQIEKQQKGNTHMTPKYSMETTDARASEPLPYDDASPPSFEGNHHQVAARGFGQTFGLHPAMAMLTVALDLMLHAADVVSAGLLIPFSMMAALALAVIVYRAQRRMYGDDRDSASIKALIVGLLTAIPSPLPYVLFVPAGVVGLAHSLRRKS
jgi:hypothetical protein